ncbi:hypothetical protein KsCSTR_15960 [Candidatus Kuenenia stuttgartiensis]|uniref:Uncharacterized protein n=1 Tax=Kuenenia stuttgartiensis TaxID=174633 RepID=A0A6G7GN83_KUEST|nr:hypothetical protein KsCSTR_15960 [Candidatus Kuenenia stuttgartiensis]
MGNELAYSHEKLLPKFTKNRECTCSNYVPRWRGCRGISANLFY